MCDHYLRVWAFERQGVGDACEESQDDRDYAKDLNRAVLVLSLQAKTEDTYTVSSTELLRVTAQSDASTKHDDCEGEHRVGG